MIRRRKRNWRKLTRVSSAKISRGGFFIVQFLFVSIVFILIARLYDIQINKSAQFAKKAEAIHETEVILKPQRGLIYCHDKDGSLIPIAINKKYYSIFAVPKEIENPSETTQLLATLLPLSEEEILKRIDKPGDPYEPLLKKVEDEDLIAKIKEANIKGIYIREEKYRYYPLENFAAQVIGFVAEGDDNKVKGRYGLEAYYEDILAGKTGEFSGVRDALGRFIRSLRNKEVSVVDGLSLRTTIDKNVQFAAEKALANLIKGRKATKGTIIVMEPQTGKILALANWPTFNLNKYNEVKDYSVFRNYAIEERYEPGSVVKPLTMAAGIDLGKVTPETTYVDKGYFKVGGHTLTNYRQEVFGKVNMRRVLEMSINTGAIFVEQQIGGNNLRKYFKKFGLDSKTGIDLPDEITGDLSNLEYPKANPSSFVTASYGAGIAITPMELIRAYSAIANKGLMVTPYILEGVENRFRAYTPVTAPEPQRVLSPETAETLTSMLVGVIENGFGGNAKIKGYSLAGKTGTAFIPFQGERGYSNDVIHTFVGFFPVSNPRFLILVKMNKPQWGADAASHTVTLAFKEVERFLINYYNIPPDEK